MDSKICRVCLDKAGTISLFDQYDELKHFVRIMKCVPTVKIEEGDGLPDTICESCLSELSVTYEFTQKCEASDKALRCLDLLQTTSEIELTLEPLKKEESVKKEIIPETLPDDDHHDSDHIADDAYDDKWLKSEYSDTQEYKAVKKLKKKKTPIPDYLRRKKPRVKSGPIQCLECGRVLTCHSAYETHMRTHTKEKPFGCEICKKFFRDKYSLKIHIKRHSSVNINEERPIKETDGRKNKSKSSPILCVICGINVQSQSAMLQHMRTHTGEKPYKCDICGKAFALKGSLTRHALCHSVKTDPALCRYVCEHCGKKFPTKSSIIVHLRVHTGDKPYVCPYCSARFCQISSLIRHKRRHTGDKPYSCPTCGKAFPSMSELRKHQLVHSNEKKFNCNICNKYFKSKESLKVHVDVVHSDKKRCVCSYCGTTFNLKGNLKLHIKRKHSEMSGFCTVCNKTCPDIHLHLRVHNGEKPFVCKICNQSYTTKNGLSYHMNYKHRDSAKFKCSTGECNKSFPKISMLEYHVLKAHLDSTPYVCHHCKRGFLRPSDLSRHLKFNHLDTHTQVKSQFIKTIKLDD